MPRVTAFAALTLVTGVLFVAGVATPLLIYVLLPALALGLIALTLTGR